MDTSFEKYGRRKFFEEKPLVYQKDLPFVARAIHDEVKEFLVDEMKRYETDHSINVGKNIQTDMEKRFSVILPEIMKEMDKKVEALRKFYEAGIQEIKGIIKSLPVPTINVTVPEQRQPDIHVNVPKQDNPTITVNVPKQEASIVNVTVPEQRQPDIHVNVPKQDNPTITVNVPEQKAPDIHVNIPEQQSFISVNAPEINFPELKVPNVVVNVPEQRAPDIHVNVPQPKTTKRRIEYDEYGRPSTVITEQDE